MATYSEMIAQIEDLKKQAEKQRKEEYSSVLKTIKRQIAEYGISAEELGFSGTAPTGKRGRKAGASKAGRKPRRITCARGRHPVIATRMATPGPDAASSPSGLSLPWHRGVV
jgi:DNA-binding protein H-NS